ISQNRAFQIYEFDFFTRSRRSIRVAGFGGRLDGAFVVLSPVMGDVNLVFSLKELDFLAFFKVAAVIDLKNLFSGIQIVRLAARSGGSAESAFFIGRRVGGCEIRGKENGEI